MELIIASVLALAAEASIPPPPVEFRLAYRNAHLHSQSASFRNDKMYRFADEAPYLQAADLQHASTVEEKGRSVVQIELSDHGKALINALADQQTNELRNNTDLTGLGLFLDGSPVMVIQGFHRLTDNVLWLSSSPAPGHATEDSDRAQHIVNAINGNHKSEP